MPYTIDFNILDSSYTAKLVAGPEPLGLGAQAATVSNGPQGTADSTGITLGDVQRMVDSMPKPIHHSDLRIPVYKPNLNFWTSENIATTMATINLQVLTVPINYVSYPTVTIPWPSLHETNACSGLSNYSYYTNVAASMYSYGSYIDHSILRVAYDETPAERAARETAAVEREAKRKAATMRAESLLFTILKPEQVRQYQDDGYFETEVNDKLYRIRKGRAQNVYLIENGKPVARYCAHPRDNTPDADAMIAQFLMLKTDEKKFLSIANRTVLM